MLAVIQQAVETRCEPQSIFASIICLGWYDGPLSGFLTLRNADFRYDLVDDDDVLRFRVFQLSPLPVGSVRKFIGAMREHGQLAEGETPPSPIWAPLWRFPTPEDQTAAEQISDSLLAAADAPVAVFCWDFDDARIVAFREIVDSEAKPDDWFAWLGLERVGERIAP